MDRRRLVTAGSLLLLAVGVAGCPPATDLGVPCTLVRRNPDGGSPVNILEEEIRAGRDVVSFGSTGCEDLTCVRDLTQPARPDTPKSPAQGYCSRQCAEGTSTCASSDGKTYYCRALIMDSVTLQALCQDNPDKCRNYFGTITSPYFCAQGAVVDAGS
jgi:hypothetical protein